MADIVSALSAALSAVRPRHGAVDATRLCRRLSVLVHADKCGGCGSRVSYAAAASFALFQRCLAVVNGEELMDIHPMPRMLLTPFRPALARTNPPSRFVFAAANLPSSCYQEGFPDIRDLNLRLAQHLL